MNPKDLAQILSVSELAMITDRIPTDTEVKKYLKKIKTDNKDILIERIVACHERGPVRDHV